MANVKISSQRYGREVSILLDGEEISKAATSYKLSGSTTTATSLEVELIPQCAEFEGEMAIVAIISNKRYRLIPLDPQEGD